MSAPAATSGAFLTEAVAGFRHGQRRAVTEQRLARGGRATWTGSGRGAFGCPGPALRSAGGGQSLPIPHHGSALVNLPSLGLLCDMALDLRKRLLIPRCLSVS